MILNSHGMTGERAWELSKWCGETAETLREYCLESDRAARMWWEDECDRPEELASSPRSTEDMLSFAERLQAEGYEWAGEAGSLFAQERPIETAVRVDRFIPAHDDDGPFEGEELMTPSQAVALRFDFDEELIDYLKGVLKSLRHARSGRGRPLRKMPWAGGWSKASRCWWVRSTYWEEVRQALLDKGIKLTGPLAHPGKHREGFFFEREQVWDAKECAWRRQVQISGSAVGGVFYGGERLSPPPHSPGRSEGSSPEAPSRLLSPPPRSPGWSEGSSPEVERRPPVMNPGSVPASETGPKFVAVVACR